MTEEMRSRVLLTATGFAAREAGRFANATSRLHRCCFELVCQNTHLGGRVRATASPNACRPFGQCKFVDYAAEAMDDSAFGLHLAGQIDPRDVGMYFYAGSAARDLGEALALFSRYCRIVNEAFRLTQRSADTAIEFEFVGLPRYAARHNMEDVVAPIRMALRTTSGHNMSPTRIAFAHTTGIRTCESSSDSLVARSSLAHQTIRGKKNPCSPPSADHCGSEAAPRSPTLLRCSQRRSGTLKPGVAALCA